MRIFHIINQMELKGGAELMLCRLANLQSESGNTVYIVVLRGNSKLAHQKLNKSIHLIELKHKNSFGALFSFIKILRLFKRLKPDISQSWLYLSDFINTLSYFFSSYKPKIFWGIRNTKIPQGYFSLQGLLVFINSAISNLANIEIICCSHASKKFHARIFYKKSRMSVIENGFSPEEYSFSFSKRLAKRNELNIKSNEILIGNLCRFDLSKGLEEFIKTISILSGDQNLKFIIQGRNIETSNFLIEKIAQYNIQDKVILAGETDDIQSFFSAIDIFCMSSIMEGFPNVLCEAMLHQRVTFSTDVGDARAIIGSDDFISPPRDPDNMAKKIKAIISRKNIFRELGEENRNNIISNFSLDAIALKYKNMYQKKIDFYEQR